MSILKDKYKIVGNGFRDFYNKQVSIKKRMSEAKRSRVIRLFVSKLGHYILNHPGGVYVEGMGYFYIYMHPFNFIPFQLSRSFMELKKYMPSFIPEKFSVFRWWAMDYMFYDSFKDKLKERLAKGHRYLNLSKGVGKGIIEEK